MTRKDSNQDEIVNVVSADDSAVELKCHRKSYPSRESLSGILFYNYDRNHMRNK
jgi:hypothetical protein